MLLDGPDTSTPSSFVPLPASGLRQENIGVKLRGISEASTEARACDRASFVSLNEHIDDLVVQAQPDAYKFKYVVLGNKVDIWRPRALSFLLSLLPLVHLCDFQLQGDPGGLETVKEAPASEEQNDIKDEPPNMVRNRQPRDDKAISVLNCPPVKSSHEHSPKHRHYISWGYWEEQPIISEESSIMCSRMCEEEVPTTHFEDHSRICTLAYKYDQMVLRYPIQF
ncbi:hypothetical protein F2Q69_00003701 [Brassica cretica]|uniref:Uncharacterized protein n=1 Tax=Brassica cretica TaxID=69181 RepID=A0A8S9P3G5_BRACR|nr:hypothetical protein F2Q69_00003701 [Brassica cretica]